MSLYRKLTEYRNQFICLDTMSGGQVLRNSGLLIEVGPDYVTLRVYDKTDGELIGDFSVPTMAIVGLWTGHRDEQELAAVVSWAASERVEQETGGKQP